MATNIPENRQPDFTGLPAYDWNTHSAPAAFGYPIYGAAAAQVGSDKFSYGAGQVAQGALAGEPTSTSNATAGGAPQDSHAVTGVAPNALPDAYLDAGGAAAPVRHPVPTPALPGYEAAADAPY